MVLYELLAGAPPFKEPGEGETNTLLTRIQRGRFEPVRRAAPGAPSWLARLVRSMLRAKPRGRPGSAQLVRRTLEQRLGVYPADARLELASWLWQQGVFRVREGETVVVSTAGPSRSRLLPGGGWAIAAALVAALLIGSFVRIEQPDLSGLLDGVFIAFEAPVTIPPALPAP